MTKKKDMYTKWLENGDLPKMMEFFKECSRKLVTQREMCEFLGITENTFYQLKQRHPDIQEAMDKARFDLKNDLMGAMYKKAVGYETIEETQDIEDTGKGQKQKRKIHRVKKQIGPDYKAIVYLMTKKYGKEYSERYEELMLAEKKIEESKEEWKSNGNEEINNNSEENS